MTSRPRSDAAGDACLSDGSCTTAASVGALSDNEKTAQCDSGDGVGAAATPADTTDIEAAGSDSPRSPARDKEDAHGQLERHPSAATSVDFPEGGLKGWLVVVGSFCAMLSLFGLINSAAVFESYFSTHQLVDNTPSEIGWIFSLYLFIVFFVGIQVGPVFDRFGARVLVAVGSTLIFLSLLLLSWCEGMCAPSAPDCVAKRACRG